MYIIYEMLFQRIMVSHLQNPLSLPPINNILMHCHRIHKRHRSPIRQAIGGIRSSCCYGCENTKAAHDLIHQWQSEWTGIGLPLNIEAMELDLLSLGSVVRFAEAWNARMGPLHVLINNAGIFSIGEPQKFSKDGYEEHIRHECCFWEAEVYKFSWIHWQQVSTGHV